MTLPRLNHEALLRQALSNVQRFNPEANSGASRWVEGASMDMPRVAQASSKGMRFAGFTHLTVMDWDWPDSAHQAADSVTIRNLGDVVEAAHEYVKSRDDSRLYLQMTNGGVHAFELGRAQTPKTFSPIQMFWR